MASIYEQDPRFESHLTYPVVVAGTTYTVAEDVTNAYAHSSRDREHWWSRTRVSCGDTVVVLSVMVYSGSLSPDRITYGAPTMTITVPDPAEGLAQEQAYALAACLVIATRLQALYASSPWVPVEGWE